MESNEQLKEPTPSSVEEQPFEVTVSPGAPGIELEGRPGVILAEKDAKPTPPPTAEELLAEVERLGVELRTVIVRTKKLPRVSGLDPHQDLTKALAVAQVELQSGFMWLRRAISQPKIF